MRLSKPALVAALLLSVVAACSGNESGTNTTSTVITTLPPVSTSVRATTTSTTAGTTTSTTSSTTTTTVGPQHPSPLNGTEVADPAKLDRRVIAVKVDNHPEARPQSGIQEADLVYELLVEGGLTRFIAVFHHSDSEYVGPIRSLRPTDSTLLTYLGAPLQISGGQPWIQSLARGRGLKLIGDDRVSTFRIGSRRAPHNLYGTTIKMRETADRRGWSDTPPDSIFTFGEPPTSFASAGVITLDWSDRPEVVWRWDPTSETYLRSNGASPHNWLSIDGDRQQIATETLLVLTARKYTASPPGEGSAVPALDTQGTGQALLFYKGRVHQGKWERESFDDPFDLTLVNGDEMVIPPGKLWISIFPSTSSLDWE